MSRILLLATTTGYQTRAFCEAAERLGVDLVYATDRCHLLEDPWQDRALPIRFYDEHGSTTTILDEAAHKPLDGVVAVGDRPTVIAARVLEGLGLPGHPPSAALTARNKLRSRERLRDHGLLVPSFVGTRLSSDPHALAGTLTFPCVIKPLELSGSRGVMRVDSPRELVAAVYRLRSLMQAPDIRAERRHDDDSALVEAYIDGCEYAVEGVMNHGRLHALAVFDKPDPLEGPFFEETIYVTPSAAPVETRLAVELAVAKAARALGLKHGPVHGECRVNDRGVFVLEVAARPIGGLCARALRFTEKRALDGHTHEVLIPLEELLLRHALGESSLGWQRESAASGVMMIPIPRRGVLRRVIGLERARRVPGIADLRITAKTDQVLTPLPEGASYLGFIFAHGATTEGVTDALRQAHRSLQFVIDQEMPVLQLRHG